jgi:hypothetical protein
MTENGTKKYVTNQELAQEVRALRWEFRFVILAAVIANQFVPSVEIAKGALGVIIP